MQWQHPSWGKRRRGYERKKISPCKGGQPTPLRAHRAACRAHSPKHEHNDVAGKQAGSSQQGMYAYQQKKQCSDRHDAHHSTGQEFVLYKQAQQSATDCDHCSHRANSRTGRLSAAAVIMPTARKIRANTTMARSSPGQPMPNPSPVQYTPNADNITPTPNFKIFSGTRASGRWTMIPASTTSAQAASAPRLAGQSKPRPAPTAMTMKTTSRPSSTTALKAAMPAIKLRRCFSRRASSCNCAVSSAKTASSSCKGIIAAARRMAFLSQRMPNKSSNIPTTNCRA